LSRGLGDRAVTARANTWRIVSVLGGVVGYGCFAAFLALVGMQSYRWFKEGEWTHISLADGIHSVLDHLHIQDDGGSRLGRLLHWLDAPMDWLGLHKVVEILPASLALFAVAIAGNFLFVYGTDRLRDCGRTPRSG
jgi:hypothetical protein